MTRDVPLSAARAVRARWVATAAAALLLLTACGQVPPAGPAPVSALPAAAALHLQTRPEGAVSTPCGPVWTEGEQLTLRGLYRTSGEGSYLDVVRVDPGSPPCWARAFLDKDLGLGKITWDTPAYVQVTGLLSAGRWDSPGLWDLQVIRWQALPLDVAAVQASCRSAVATQVLALQALDWASLALPSFITGTAGFRPSAADLANVVVRLDGADDRSPLLVLTARGPDLPNVRPLVHRWVAVECVYDVGQKQVVEVVATIQGEVQE